MNFKEILKGYNYLRKGLKIGFVIGLIDLILLFFLSSVKFVVYLNYIPLYFLYPLVENLTSGLGEIRFIIVSFLVLSLSLLFYIILGGTIGLILDKLKK